ncbi:MAG: hypothetical protein JSV52_13725, partial [Candidatus Zixiibacteriota bacterium]
WEEVKRRKELVPKGEEIEPPDSTDLGAGTYQQKDDQDGANQSDDPDLFSQSGKALNKSRAKSISANSIQNGIISALRKCPNNSCTTKSITKRVLKELGIITRGNPRLELEKRVKRNVGVLVQKGQVKEYKAKNNRLRLLH